LGLTTLVPGKMSSPQTISQIVSLSCTYTRHRVTSPVACLKFASLSKPRNVLATLIISASVRGAELRPRRSEDRSDGIALSRPGQVGDVLRWVLHPKAYARASGEAR